MAGYGLPPLEEKAGNSCVERGTFLLYGSTGIYGLYLLGRAGRLPPYKANRMVGFLCLRTFFTVADPTLAKVRGRASKTDISSRIHLNSRIESGKLDIINDLNIAKYWFVIQALSLGVAPRPVKTRELGGLKTGIKVAA